MSTDRVVEVLLVEDDLADVYMVQEALEDWSVPTSLHIANDGVQATEFLRREGAHADAPRPAFVILDLNLPRKNGFEVLTELKNDEDLRIIPVVVFTTSQAPEHIQRSYAAHANAYVVKPGGYDDFARVVRDIDHFYTQISSVPPASSSPVGTGSG